MGGEDFKRTGSTDKKWWQMGSDQERYSTSRQSRFNNFIKVLRNFGPTAARSYQRWQSRNVGFELSEIEKDHYSLIRSILSSQDIPFVFNTGLNSFEFEGPNDRGRLFLIDDTVILLFKGTTKKIPSTKLIKTLFKLGFQLKN